MSEVIDRIVEDVKGLSVLELSELVKRLEEELGVSAAAPVAVAAVARNLTTIPLQYKYNMSQKSTLNDSIKNCIKLPIMYNVYI